MKCDPIDFLPLREKRILRAATTKGYIEIRDTGKIIFATDNYQNRIAETFTRNETGLAWIKAKCRGYHDWNRLNWKVLTVS